MTHLGETVLPALQGVVVLVFLAVFVRFAIAAMRTDESWLRHRLSLLYLTVAPVLAVSLLVTHRWVAASSPGWTIGWLALIGLAAVFAAPLQVRGHERAREERATASDSSSALRAMIAHSYLSTAGLVFGGGVLVAVACGLYSGGLWLPALACLLAALVVGLRELSRPAVALTSVTGVGAHLLMLHDCYLVPHRDIVSVEVVAEGDGGSTTRLRINTRHKWLWWRVSYPAFASSEQSRALLDGQSSAGTRFPPPRARV